MEGNGSKKYVDKRCVSVTIDEGRINRIDVLVGVGKFRNRSHALDEACRLLLEKEESSATGKS